MVDIVISGDGAESAARAMHDAVREIFEVEAIRSTGGGAKASGTRSLELLMFLLTLPPALLATADIVARSRAGERLRRLIRKAEEQRKATGARILIDPGNGKPIPLEEANREVILDALAAFEKRTKR